MSLFRSINAIIRWLGWQTVITLSLLLVGLISSALTLAEVIRGLDVALLLPIVVISLFFGWWLATLRFLPAWLALSLILMLGVELITVRVGRLETTLLELGRSLVGVGRSLRDGFPAALPDTTALSLAVSELWASLTTLYLRLYSWGFALSTGEPVYDPVAIALVWGLTLWLVSAWAGWSVRRWGRPLTALTPTGVLLATTLAYRPQEAFALIPLLGVALLLMGLVSHQTRERVWRANNIDYSGDLHMDLSAALIPLSAVILILAVLLPSISVRQLARLFAEQARLSQPIADSFGVRAQGDRPTALQEFRAPGLPRDHLLGSGPELSERLALVVQPAWTDVSTSAPNEGESAPRYYWRTLTYDRYTGRGWRTSGVRSQNYQAGEQTIASVPPHRQILRQTVRVISDQNSRLYAAGQLVTADHTYRIEWRGPRDAFGAIIEAKTYQVDSLVSTAGQTGLRRAGADYPDWVKNRYLRLPPQTPDRVLALARDLTATAPTPYDRAKAIERYLRAFPYSLDLPEPPHDRDMVDYFLFDLQQGYCDYYATSMVVLARAAGLPARLAVGYANGAYDSTGRQYIVTEAEAHSWVEIYFPDYGWIEFEPTAAQPISDYQDKPELAGDIPEPLPALGETSTSRGRPLLVWGGIFLGALTLAVGGGLLWTVIEQRRLHRLSPDKAVAAIYRRLQRSGQGLAVPIEQGETPYEFAALLEHRLDQLAERERWRASLQPAHAEVQWLADLYVRSTYSQHRPDQAEQASALKVWQRLRKRLWLARISGWLARRNN